MCQNLDPWSHTTIECIYWKHWKLQSAMVLVWQGLVIYFNSNGILMTTYVLAGFGLGKTDIIAKDLLTPADTVYASPGPFPITHPSGNPPVITLNPSPSPDSPRYGLVYRMINQFSINILRTHKGNDFLYTYKSKYIGIRNEKKRCDRAESGKGKGPCLDLLVEPSSGVGVITDLAHVLDGLSRQTTLKKHVQSALRRLPLETPFVISHAYTNSTKM
ncbi:hypothetical protein Sjap_008367 [Stephania japonica]|uniref:Uncharacterized protein n=1 Tax=Stephania japonica TaxID=461633 RepID=A0AAP0JPD2_9MAGN